LPADAVSLKLSYFFAKRYGKREDRSISKCAAELHAIRAAVMRHVCAKLGNPWTCKSTAAAWTAQSEIVDRHKKAGSTAALRETCVGLVARLLLDLNSDMSWRVG
jgi:hypothetical protein